MLKNLEDTKLRIFFHNPDFYILITTYSFRYQFYLYIGKVFNKSILYYLYNFQFEIDNLRDRLQHTQIFVRRGVEYNIITI